MVVHLEPKESVTAVVGVILGASVDVSSILTKAGYSNEAILRKISGGSLLFEKVSESCYLYSTALLKITFVEVYCFE